MIMPAPRVTVVVPAYNEASRLPATVRSLCDYLDRLDPAFEVIVVDDGSTDATASALAAFDDRRVSVVARPANGGKGAAVRDGIARARGRTVVYLDADLPYPLEAIEAAIAHVESGAHVVAGARDLHPHGRRAQPWPRRVAAGALQRLTSGITAGVGDTQCGFKAFDGAAARTLFAALRTDGFAFDVELLALAHTWNLRIVRLPIAMASRSGSSVVMARDGARMLLDILRIRADARRRTARDLAHRFDSRRVL